MNEIEEGNKLIAVFLGGKLIPQYGLIDMGLDRKTKYRYEHISELEYDSSWDRLYLAIAKISTELGWDFYPETWRNSLDQAESYSARFIRRRGPAIGAQVCETAIEAAWKAVVEFIKWYNHETAETVVGI